MIGARVVTEVYDQEAEEWDTEEPIEEAMS
jgi:hypothetical protein